MRYFVRMVPEIFCLWHLKTPCSRNFCRRTSLNFVPEHGPNGGITIFCHLAIHES